MVGGAISGYCAIGSVESAMTPMSVMTMLMTPAKIGRSMKKCGKFIRRSAFIFSARESEIPAEQLTVLARELAALSFPLAAVAAALRQRSRRFSVRFSQSVFLRKDHQFRDYGVRRYYRASRRIRISALAAN